MLENNMDLEATASENNTKLDVDTNNKPQDIGLLENVEVEIAVVLGYSAMSIGNILKLSRGAIIELNRKVGEPIDILVNNRLVAKGEIIIVENRVAVTLTEITNRLY